MFSQETFLLQTFSLTFWEMIHFLKMLHCPGHPVLSVLSILPCQANFRLTCLRCTVPFFLSQLSCQGCPAIVVTSWLPCLASLFLLSCSRSCPSCIILHVLSGCSIFFSWLRSYLCFHVLIVLLSLFYQSSPSCPMPADLHTVLF